MAGVLVWLAVANPRASASRDRGPGSPAVGAPIDTLKLVPLTGDGKAIDSSNLQGKVTFVNFWGPWCGPCVVEFPHLAELEQHFRGNPDFQFLSVSCSGGPGEDADMQASTAAFLAAHKAEFPTYRDPFQISRQHLAQRATLGGVVYPTTVVLDRDGIIRALWVGYMPGDETTMRQIIEEQLRKN
jgi:thiol-disulfide isomerase/thioredoxin